MILQFIAIKSDALLSAAHLAIPIMILFHLLLMTDSIDIFYQNLKGIVFKRSGTPCPMAGAFLTAWNRRHHIYPGDTAVP
jgi:hypothetical protein